MEFNEFDAADYTDDAEDVAAFLNAALEMGGTGALPRALGTIARSKGMTAVAEKTGLGREHLYNALTDGGNPTLATFDKVLSACGVRIKLEAIC